MEIGKLFYFILLSNIFPSQFVSSKSPSSLKGGLVYSDEFEQGPIYLNPQTYTVVRNVDTSVMQNFISFTNGFAKMYEGQCSKTETSLNQISNELTKTQTEIDGFKPEKVFYVCNQQTPLHFAERICKTCKEGSYLPEIRTLDEKETVRKLAIKHGIFDIPAGIKYHSESGRFRYMTDLRDVLAQSPFQIMEYGGKYGPNSWHTGRLGYDATIRSMADEYMVIYTMPNSNFVMRLANGEQQNAKQKAFICEYDKKPPQIDVVAKNEQTMMSLVTHNCKRDKTSLITAAKAAVTNAATILDFKIDPTNEANEIELSEYLPKFDQYVENNKRKKRETDSAPLSDSEIVLIEAKKFILYEVKNKLIKVLQKDESEDFNILKTVYGLLKPKTTFNHWFSALLNDLTIADLKSFDKENVLFSGKKIKCLKSQKCTKKGSIKENAYLKLYLQRQSRKLVKSILLTVHKRMMNEKHIKLIKENNDNEQRHSATKREAFKPNPFRAEWLFGGPASALYSIYSAFNMSGGHRLHRRALPLVPILGALAFGTAGANIGSSITNGGAPLSWFGKPLGKLFGFASEDQVHQLNLQLNQHADAISNLHLSNVETRKAVNELIDSQKRFEHRVAKAFKAATAVMLEADLRSFLRYLITLLETNSNKIVILGLAASSGRASVIALSQKELSEIADRAMKEKGIKLSTDLSTVKMSMLKIDDELRLVFDIPILVEENLYHFYKVDPIPLFENNTMYIPELDAPFLGISKTGSSYVTLSSEEFARCTTDPLLCTVSSPIIPMTSKAHCTVTTYVTGSMTCDLLESNKPANRYIHVKGNNTIFSVPEETMVYIKCDNPMSKSKSQETTFVMKDMGQVTFKPGCTINFPDGTKFKTPNVYETETIDDSKIFRVIDTYSIPKNARIKRFYTYDHRTISKLDTEYSFPTAAELVKDIFQPTRALGFVIQFLMATGFIFAIAFLCLCYWRPIRICLGNTKFIPCCNPVDPDKVSDPISKDKIKGILKTGMSKAKSTSDLVLDNLNTRRKRLLRSKSAVSFGGEQKKNYDDSSDEETSVELVSVPKDRIKMVYKKGPDTDDELTYFSSKKFETN